LAGECDRFVIGDGEQGNEGQKEEQYDLFHALKFAQHAREVDDGPVRKGLDRAYDMDVIRFGPFVLDPGTGELRRDGDLIPLAPQPFRLLHALASRPGQLLTREELRQQVWDEGTFVDFERGLNFCVLQVRTAIGDDAKRPLYIETLPKRGYRFV